MATPLPLPPAGTPYLDPATGQVSIAWQNYFLALGMSVASGFAPVDAQYLVSTNNATLTNERNLGALASGYLKLTTGAGIGIPSTVTAIPGTDIAGAALTRTSDTNVTLTLGGTPTTALLAAASITAGWAGTLAQTRGGTGKDTSGATDGQILIGKSSDHSLNLASLTAGANITITPGAGSISIAAASGGSGALSLLTANSGTTTNGSAENVDTVAITGLTVKDTLIAYVTMFSEIAATASPSLYNSTDSVIINSINDGNAITGTNKFISQVQIMPLQTATTAIRSLSWGNEGGTQRGNGGNATFTTAWTGSWTLALRQGGVTATGTLAWTWAVYKLAGQ